MHSHVDILVYIGTESQLNLLYILFFLNSSFVFFQSKAAFKSVF